MEEKLVSICMPVYNGANYMRQAIDSALGQDHGNVEVVVVNDGSNDDGETDRIARSFGDRIRYVVQENRGVSGALNTALDAARGDYFAWLSHDDVHLPHKTRAQLEFLRKLGRPDACLFSDYDLIDPQDNLIATVRLPAERIRRSPRLPLLNGYINGCSLLIPMHVIRRFGPFDEGLRFTQDYDLWNKILGAHEFFHQPEVLIRYRVHPQQDTQTQKVGPESNPLWRRMMDDRSPTQRAQVAGSSQRFFQSIGEFLKPTPMQQASSYALDRARDAATGTLVSVVIPFFNEVDLVHRAIESVRSQMDAAVEIIVVNDGSTEEVTSVESLAQRDRRIKLIHQPNRGVAAARNRGLLHATGEYIAFLDADDTFLPHKISRQVELMQAHGTLISHTSYYVAYPGRKGNLGILRSGQLSGACYPQLIASCPIAVPTVMLHRSVIDEGFTFPDGCHIGEDVLAWVDLAAKYLIMGIDEPLTVVEWQPSSAAMSVDKQVRGVTAVLELLSSHPIHGRHSAALESLKVYLETLKERKRNANSADWSESLVDFAWRAPAGITAEKIGRVA